MDDNLIVSAFDANFKVISVFNEGDILWTDAFAEFNRIKTVIIIDYISAVAFVENVSIITFTAVKIIITFAAVKNIISVSSVKIIITFATVNNIVSARARNSIVAAVTVQFGIVVYCIKTVIAVCTLYYPEHSGDIILNPCSAVRKGISEVGIVIIIKIILDDNLIVSAFDANFKVISVFNEGDILWTDAFAEFNRIKTVIIIDYISAVAFVENVSIITFTAVKIIITFAAVKNIISARA